MQLNISIISIFLTVLFDYVFCSSSIVYTAENFNTKVLDNHHFVKFYAPWCGHCKKLAPTWDELAEKYNVEDDSDDKIVIAKVDCTLHTSVCADQDVNAYPTLKFFKKGSIEGLKYRGSRDLKALSDFIVMNLNYKLEDEPEVPTVSPDQTLMELTDKTFTDFIAKGNHFVKFYAPWCGHCQKLAPTWDQLADSFKHDPSVRISKVDCTDNRGVCNKMEVKSYPTLIWIVDGKMVEKYQGGRTHEDLKHFVSKMKESQIRSDQKPEDSNLSVVELSASNFDEAIKKPVVFIEFYAPWCGHCKVLAPTWLKLAEKFVSNPNIMIAKVDCIVEDKLCEKLSVDGFPTLFLYVNGKFKEEYNQERDLQQLYDYVAKHIPSHDEL